jgi:transcription initiation factor IIE alpha subunit
MLTMRTMRAKVTGMTSTFHSDTQGLWWVYCDFCESNVGESVPYEMAEEKKRSHLEQHGPVHQCEDCGLYYLSDSRSARSFTCDDCGGPVEAV